MKEHLGRECSRNERAPTENLIRTMDNSHSDLKAHLDFLMLTHTRKDSLTHPGQHLRRISSRLIYPKLNVVLSQEKRLTTQEMARRFRRDARSRASF